MRELTAEQSLLISGGESASGTPVQVMDTIRVTDTYDSESASGFSFGDMIALGGTAGGLVGLDAWLAGTVGTLSVGDAIALGTVVGAATTAGVIISFSAGYAAGTFLYNRATGYIYRKQ